MSGIANRDWFEKLDGESLQRILAYCDEHRTTPPQAIKDWIWSKKVNNKTIRGQTSLFD